MKHTRTAFSLVEMLVAVILISLLIGIAIFSFRHQLITVKKTKEVGINKVLHFNQLRSSIGSMKYYVVDDYDMLNHPMKNLHFYFNGNKNEIDYITTNPLFSEEVAVVKLRCEESNLTYKEEALYGNIDFLRPTVLGNSRKTTLYKDLDTCNFHYFYKQQKSIALYHQIPSSIVINMASKEKETTFFIHVKSDYNTSKGNIEYAIYADEY